MSLCLMRNMPMDEAKVREIHRATELSGYTHDELREADQWVKDAALEKLEQHLKATATPEALSEFVLLMARCHYGSIETDAFLWAHQCYPEWLKD